MVADIKIGITGLPESGKTEVLVRIIEMLGEEDVKIGGIIDEPVKDGRKKTGYTVKDIVTGEKEVFASVDIESRIMVGKFGIDPAAMEKISVKALKHACEECDIIVIDEVGKMEVECEAFVGAVRSALDAGKPMIITLHKKSRNPLLQDIRRRDDVRILEVTPTNRNILPFKVIRLLHGENA